jgi:hypothetical protein
MRLRWKGGEIYRSQKPRVIFTDLASAFAEAQRKLSEHPGEQYAVFECIGYVGNGAKVRPRSTITTASRTDTEPTVEHRKPKAQQCQTADKVQGSYEKAASTFAK